MRVPMSRPFLIGLLIGFFWLLPVSGPPRRNVFEGDITALRVLRLVLPLAVWLLVERREVTRLLHSLLHRFPSGRFPLLSLRIALFCLTLGFFPVLAGLLNRSPSYIVSVVAPLVLSVLVLAAIVLMEEETLREWTLGVCFAALAFLIVGLCRYGFSESSFWGRPRAMMGFTHPLITASAVLSAMLFFGLYGRERLARRLRIPARFLPPALGLVTFFLLLISQSRNLLLSTLVALCLYLMARRTAALTRFGVFLMLLIGPMVFYAYVLFSPPNDPLWAWLNAQSSYRLAFYQKLMLDLIQSGGSAIAPDASRLSEISEQLGFAATDSVFLSYLVNYGIGSLCLLLLLFGAIGWQLARFRQNALAFGIFGGLMVFYNLDAQGLTASNLIIFILFTYTVRCALRSAARPPQDAVTPGLGAAPTG